MRASVRTCAGAQRRRRAAGIGRQNKKGRSISTLAFPIRCEADLPHKACRISSARRHRRFPSFFMSTSTAAFSRSSRTFQNICRNAFSSAMPSTLVRYRHFTPERRSSIRPAALSTVSCCGLVGVACRRDARQSARPSPRSFDSDDSAQDAAEMPCNDDAAAGAVTLIVT